MSLRTLHLVFLVAVLTLAGAVSKGFAFSFGGVEIHSKFGEKFNADLDLMLEEAGEFQVQIGDKMDYRRLELERPEIVDDLVIEQIPETEGRIKTVRVKSRRPLFFPSFNLVVRGTFKGGTVLERYLITVDFQQSLALNVADRPRSNFEETITKEEVDLLKGGKAAAKTSASEESKIEAVEKEMGDEGTDAEVGSAETSKKSGDIKKPSKSKAASGMGKPPSVIIGKRGEDSFFPGATWVSPIVSIPAMPPMDPSLPKIADAGPAVKMAAEKPLDPPQAISSKVENDPPAMEPEKESFPTGLTYGPLVKGENLLSISRKVYPGSTNASRIAVALWMDNPESFLFGNMNGLKQGSQIKLENLEKRMEEIDSTLAQQILRSQSREWKIIREKLASTDSEDLEAAAHEIPLPSENEDQKKMIFEMLQTWKTSWENGDLEKHLSLFSERNTGPFADESVNLRFQKKRMFNRHKKVKLGIQQASLALKGGQPVVSFGQSFSSGKMESYGLKDVGIVWESGAWKILKEKFKVNEYLEKSETSADDLSVPKEEIFSRERTLAVPFVIHASSHLDYQMATQAVNELRKFGFSAYSSPVNISRNRKIFRVYVGRFSSLDLAEELVADLRKQVISQNAIPVKYPFTFLMGEYELADEAESLIHNLRSKGFSPLLFTFSEKEFLNPRFRVFLGAFSTEQDSGRLSDALKAQEFSFKLLAP